MTIFTYKLIQAITKHFFFIQAGSGKRSSERGGVEPIIVQDRFGGNEDVMHERAIAHSKVEPQLLRYRSRVCGRARQLKYFTGVCFGSFYVLHLCCTKFKSKYLKVHT